MVLSLKSIAYGNLLKPQLEAVNKVSTTELEDIKDTVRAEIHSMLPETIWVGGGVDELGHPIAVQLKRGIHCMQSAKGIYCRQKLKNGEPTCRWHRKININAKYSEKELMTEDELREYGTVETDNRLYTLTLLLTKVPELENRIGRKCYILKRNRLYAHCGFLKGRDVI